MGHVDKDMTGWILLAALMVAFLCGIGVGWVVSNGQHSDFCDANIYCDQDKICQFYRNPDCERCHDELFDANQACSNELYDRERALRAADELRGVLGSQLDTCHSDYASCRKDLYETWKDLNVTCERGGD